MHYKRTGKHTLDNLRLKLLILGAETTLSEKLFHIILTTRLENILASRTETERGLLNFLQLPLVHSTSWKKHQQIHEAFYNIKLNQLSFSLLAYYQYLGEPINVRKIIYDTLQVFFVNLRWTSSAFSISHF